MCGERMEMNSWFTTTIRPILTIEREGDEWGDVIVHKSAEELKQIIRENPGTLGGLARLALEILRLRERIVSGYVWPQ